MNTITKGTTVAIDAPTYVYYAIIDGVSTPVQRKVTNHEHFTNLGLPVYTWVSTDKDGVETTNYSVELAHYQANKPARRGLKEQAMVDAMVSSGMTEEQALAIIAVAKA